MKRLEMPAKLLKNGDVLRSSTRYGTRLRGTVRNVKMHGNLVFFDTPLLADEDVAFQANEQVSVERYEEERR